MSNIRINKSHLDIVQEIQSKVKNYLIANPSIKSLIMGISGGFDSGFNAALLRPICDELGISLIGAYIHIESNKKEESDRADMIGKAFCHEYSSVDLTELFHVTNETINGDILNSGKEITQAEKVMFGNIKARMRMVYLYNMAAKYKGIVIDNDNLSERQEGFWTLHGDEGDLTPLASFYKTECYELAKAYKETLESEEAKEALQSVIDAVPTAGLGITSSDVEELGVSSYNEVDTVLKWIEKHPNDPCPYEKDSGEAKVWLRWKNTEFKRNHPHRIAIYNA